MSFYDANGLSAADIAAVTGNGNGMFGGNNDSLTFLIILWLFAMMGGNWGNGYGNNSGVQEGFDQAAVMSGISGINTALSNAEVSRCNTQANILQTLNNMQANLTGQNNDIAMALQNCCCENRQATADLKYTVAQESAATRANDQANTQIIMDKLCQLEMDGIKQNYENRIAGMQSQIDGLTAALNTANNQAYTNNQFNRVLADNAAQTQALEQYLNPVPIPAYVVQNPNCCTGNNNYGCGCGM